LEEYKILKNAPITEALIDIRVKLSANFDVQKIDSLYESIKEQYPHKETQRISKVEIETKEEKVKPISHKINGYRYFSSDKKQVIQARMDGFTFSRLHPYIKWEDLRDEAYRLWLLYKDITSPEMRIRVALRYINNLKIPLPIKDFGDYLTAPPIVPEGLSQLVPSFLTRITFFEPALNAYAIITQALEPLPSEVKHAPIILDIDMFRYRQEGIEEKDAWETIEKLRHHKNKIFFKSITNKLKEMYE
jgi:uncharacterized protein (TIGR04255 family)